MEPTLKQLYARYTRFPNGGPRLLVLPPTRHRTHWSVGIIFNWVGRFKSRRATVQALKDAGFVSHHLPGGELGDAYWHTR